MTPCFAGPVNIDDAVEAPVLGPVVCAALGMEARAVRRGLTRTPVVVVGYRARRAARLPGACAALVTVGFGGALDERLRPGDVLVADEIRGPEPDAAATPCSAPRLLAAELIRDGLSVQTGPLVTTDHVVRGKERALWAARGARAADMESAVVAARARRPAGRRRPRRRRRARPPAVASGHDRPRAGGTPRPGPHRAGPGALERPARPR
ncbi:hypothetical protein LUX57_47135 [Actinomadura madurae]|uniref:phosphorylase family protein n=1 Tax=Actinomadura madurae TaxID=1993 RepID=UPI0020D23CC7|nr:hypothetical protein [Actinomadura madurae]MCP9971739.1 hypothetical protein [Actinomadura madurae]